MNGRFTCAGVGAGILACLGALTLVLSSHAQRGADPAPGSEAGKFSAAFHGGTSCRAMGRTGHLNRRTSISINNSEATVINSSGRPLAVEYSRRNS